MTIHPEEIPLRVDSDITMLASAQGVETDDVELSQLEEQRSSKNREQPKIAFSQSRTAALKYGSVHILPVLATITLLCLNSINYYWTDLGAKNQNLVLSSLQYIAKAHEILMAFSIMTIVLSGAQFLLLSSQGIPLGLVTAPYRLSEAGYVFSREFWAAVLAQKRYSGFRWRVFGLLVFISVILTALLGPSSAVLMIPQLDWWPILRPFSGAGEVLYLQMGQNDIWPSTLPSPASFATNDPYSINYGYTYVQDWASAYFMQGTPSNITVDVDDGFYRLLTSIETTNSSRSGSLFTASTISQRQAKDLGSFWQFLQFHSHSMDPNPILRPMLQTFPTDQSTTIKKPLVQVECQATNLTESLTSLDFPHDQLYSQDPLHNFSNVSWPVPEIFLNWTLFQTSLTDPILANLSNFTSYLTNGGTYLNMNGSFVDVSKFVNGPSAAAVFLVPDEYYNAQIVACSILAFWSPVSIWSTPGTDMIVHDDSPDASQIQQSLQPNNVEDLVRIQIPSNWTNLLNSPINGDAQRTTTLQAVVKQLRSAPVKQIDGLPGLIYGAENSLFAQTISLYMAEALARVNFVMRTSWIQQIPKAGSKVQPLFFEMDDLGQGNRSEQFDSIVTYGGPNNVTKFGFNLQRYGYAWSFRALSTRLAAVVLVLQMLFAVAHLAVLLWTGWVSEGWKSPGEILALAVRRQDSRALHSAGVGIRTSENWKEIMSIRTTKNDPEMIELFDDIGVANLGMRLEPGKKYH